MKNSRAFIKRFVSLLLAILMIATMSSVGFAYAAPNQTSFIGTSLRIVPNGTFAKLLEAGISSGVKSGATAALSPLISIIGQELLGLPSETGLPEIMERLDEIDGKLDEIRAELSEGFDKILAELDKSEKMDNTVKALAQAEFLASLIMNLDNSSELPQTIEEIASLSGEQQKEIIEINAEAIKYDTVNALYLELAKAKAYLACGGFIDSNYETAYEVYYAYMKKQSMFCGEAAMKSEAFWDVMMESYAKSCVALIYALEQQLAMYELMESEPSEQITQQAIDAASIATSFGKKSVIESNLKKIKAEAQEVLNYYNCFLDKADQEATVFINKGTCYLRLNPELSTISFDGCGSYEEYTSGEGFEKGGITEELYELTLRQVQDYFFNGGDSYIETNTVSFEEFITNSGSCIRRNVYRDVNGFTFLKTDADWAVNSKYVFKHMLLNMKAVKYNTDNKADSTTVNTIINYIKSDYPTKTISEYLESVGFSFGSHDISKDSGLYMPTGNLDTGNGSKKITCDGKIYDLTSLTKEEAGSFDKAIGTANPSGTLFYLSNAEDTISVSIVSEGMDTRIYKGIYTITAKEIVGYNPDGTPIYKAYKEVREVKGDNTVDFRLPSTLDYKTITITLGYDGLGASSNHESVCSYSLNELDTAPAKLTLKMVGYTKIWLGYGVKATIFCDDEQVANGNG